MVGQQNWNVSIDAGGTVTAYSDGQGAVALRVSVLEVPL